MNQEVKQKKQKKIMIYAMIISFICIVGISYAFFTAGLSSETSTTLRADAGTMKITYDGGANITLSGIYPRDEVWATKNITVTGNNTTDAEMYYKLTLVVDSNTFKTSDSLQYELVSTNTSTNGEVISSISKTDITSSSIKLGNGHFIKANNAKHTYQLKIYYPRKETNQNDNQGASFSAHVEITSVKVPKTSGTLAELILYNNEVKNPLTTPGKEVNAHIVDDSIEVTTNVDSKYQAYYITYGESWKATWNKRFDLTDTAVTSDTYANSYSSLVGKYLSSDEINVISSSTAQIKSNTTDLDAVYYVVNATSDSFTYKTLGTTKNTTEALLASTEDDYGTSYYFRGAVKNNYVQFANKCWRIVRITGDGSIKLALHNDNTSKVANPCSSANNSATAAFAHFNDDKFTSAFNSEWTDNENIGFMYGTSGASDYASTHANTNKSTILTNLETWYTNNLAAYESKLADTIWCNDKSTISDTTFNPWNYKNLTGLGYGDNYSYYSSTKRLYSSKGMPSLKCLNDNDGGKLSKFTVSDRANGNGSLTYKIGLLTIDELAFAGTCASKYNNSDFLQENATSNWWTLTPSLFTNGYPSVWGVSYLGLLGPRWYTFGELGLRPSISLVSSITVSSGTGTSEDPYIVN